MRLAAMTGVEKDIVEVTRTQSGAALAPEAKDVVDVARAQPREANAARAPKKARGRSYLWIYIVSAAALITAVALFVLSR